MSTEIGHRNLHHITRREPALGAQMSYVESKNSPQVYPYSHVIVGVPL